MKMIKPSKQLYYNICVTVLAISYFFFLDPSYFFFLLMLRLTIWIFVKKNMTIFAKKKKKMCKEKKKKDRWIQITNQVNVLVVSESGVRWWPLIDVWGGMASVFGY